MTYCFVSDFFNGVAAGQAPQQKSNKVFTYQDYNWSWFDAAALQNTAFDLKDTKSPPAQHDGSSLIKTATFDSAEVR